MKVLLFYRTDVGVQSSLMSCCFGIKTHRQLSSLVGVTSEDDDDVDIGSEMHNLQGPLFEPL